PEEFAYIASAGYNLVINLATPTSSNWNPDENTLVESLGMEYISIPIDWEYPTLSDFEDFADILDGNSDRETGAKRDGTKSPLRDRKIWVHCSKNMRVSAMIYLYHRIRKNYIEEVARRYLEQVWQPNEIWQNFIDATLMLYGDE
ncbi:MAG TPA: hypothetical protein DDW51_20400, partial [Cyanobacteria bacterium UBA11367]|nr:hypothetical protein [Cyanobacteria bacterium UBA11367]